MNILDLNNDIMGLILYCKINIDKLKKKKNNINRCKTRVINDLNNGFKYCFNEYLDICLYSHTNKTYNDFLNNDGLWVKEIMKNWIYYKFEYLEDTKMHYKYSILNRIGLNK